MSGDRVPFPVHALPDSVAAYVEATAAALRCDASMVAVPLLPVLASAIGTTRRIRLKESWHEPAIVWAAVVADSGSMKSPAFEAALKPLQVVQEEIAARHRADLRKFESAMDEYRARLRAWDEQGHRSPKPVEPRRPTLQRLRVQDVTVEAVVVVLEECPRGVVLARDELAGWFASFGRYSTGRAGTGDAASWIEFFHARPVSVDRKTGEKRALHVPMPAVSIAGTIQPATLGQLITDSLIESGLGPRLLLCLPPRVPKEWTEADVPREVAEACIETVRCLVGVEHDVDAEGRPQARDVALLPEAKALWVSFYGDHANRQAAANGDRAAVLAKLECYVARLALVFALVRRVSGETGIEAVDAESMRGAIEVVEWFVEETDRVYATLRETEDQRRLRRIAEEIAAKGGETTVRDWQRSHGSRLQDRDAAHAELARLVKAGWAVWKNPSKPGPKGGHPRGRTLVLVERDDREEG